MQQHLFYLLDIKPARAVRGVVVEFGYRSLPLDEIHIVVKIARVGRAFSYTEGTPKGPFVGKKATFIIATGGIYDAKTQMGSFNFVEPYLRSVFGFLGLTDITFLSAGGTMALNQGHDRDAFLAPHLAACSAAEPDEM